MQDYATYKYTNELQDPDSNGAEWTPDPPSVVIGILGGIFVAIIGFKIAEYRATQTAPIETPMVEQIEDAPLVLDFYEALKAYEVLPRGRP